MIEIQTLKIMILGIMVMLFITVTVLSVIGVMISDIKDLLKEILRRKK